MVGRRVRAVELLKTQLGEAGNPHWQQIDERALVRIMLPSVVDKKLRDTVTGRMLRTLCDRTTMPQAEFMSMYMVRCERPRKTAPSSFNNNFGRFDLGVAEWRAKRLMRPLHLGCINRSWMSKGDERMGGDKKKRGSRMCLDWWWRSRGGIIAQLEDRTLGLMEGLFERLVVERDGDEETVRWYESMRDEMRARTR